MKLDNKSNQKEILNQYLNTLEKINNYSPNTIKSYKNDITQYLNEENKVGEFSNDGINAPSNLAVKLLRSEILITNRPSGSGRIEPFPTWSLMMKNIYPLGAFPLEPNGFRFEIQYRDDQTGVASNTLQNAQTLNIASTPLLQVMNLDRLDQTQFQTPDGFFDYVEGITVNSQNGLVIFPSPEPFGTERYNTAETYALP